MKIGPSKASADFAVADPRLPGESTATADEEPPVEEEMAAAAASREAESKA